MSFVERVNQGESLASWLNWLTEPPAVSWSVIMGDLSAIWKGEIWTHPNAFRTGPGSCAVHSMCYKYEYSSKWYMRNNIWIESTENDPLEWNNTNSGCIIRLSSALNRTKMEQRAQYATNKICIDQNERRQQRLWRTTRKRPAITCIRGRQKFAIYLR